MRRERWLCGVLSALLSFLLSFSALLCLQSAFGLTARSAHVALGCAVSAVLFSLGFSLKWWYIPPLALIPLGLWLWRRGALADHIAQLLCDVSTTYDRAYGCGVIFWRDAALPGGDTTLALCAAGCIICFFCAWAVCRKKTVLPALLTAALPLAACFVVTDRVPQTGWLFLLLFAAVLLLVCRLPWRHSLRQGNRLALLAAVPVALALLVLFWAVPRDTYRGQARADRILQAVQDWAREVAEPGTAGTSTSVEQTVELDRMGRLVQTHTPVMTVQTDGVSGTLYLRRQGYQTYSGTSWTNEYSNDIYDWIRWEQLDRAGQVTVTTRAQHLMRFVPYYVQDVTVSSLGITENISGDYSYTYALYQLPPDAPSASTEPRPGGLQLPVGSPSPDAVSLPAGTVAWAEEIALPLVADGATVQEQAQAIGTYVRGLAEYSRDTARMPAGQTDFARWFVTDAESGYCVHFATTAAVLLRAAGIQAQYVEGYTVQLTDGVAATVYEDQAHAWVEYYDPAVGWRILECTPPEGVPGYIHATQGNTQTTPQTPQTPAEPEVPTQPPPQAPASRTILGPILLWCGIAVLSCLVVAGQWKLRLWWQKRHFARLGVNQKAVLLWRQLAKASRLLGQQPAQSLYQLAQKAKFSNHTLTAGELARLTGALADCHRALKARPWYLQPVYTLVFAVY